MSDIDTIRDDLAFLKAVASDEGAMPRVVGAQLAAAGLLFGVPAIFAWAGLRGFIPGPTGWTSWVGVWSTVIYVPLSIVLGLKFKPPRPEGARAKAMGAAWSGVGLTTLSMLIIIFTAGARLHEPQMWQVWTCVCFALYGAAWWVVAFMRGHKGWFVVAIGSYLTAICNAFLISSWDVILVCGLGLIAWLSGPGFVILLRPAPKA